MKLGPISFVVMMAISAVSTASNTMDQSGTTGKPTNQSQVSTVNAEAIVVRVVSTADCQNTPPTIRLIQEAASELNLLIELNRLIVTTQEEANKYRFIGSPTVHIDGLDLQPDMRTNTKYGFT